MPGPENTSPVSTPYEKAKQRTVRAMAFVHAVRHVVRLNGGAKRIDCTYWPESGTFDLHKHEDVEGEGEAITLSGDDNRCHSICFDEDGPMRCQSRPHETGMHYLRHRAQHSEWNHGENDAAGDFRK